MRRGGGMGSANGVVVSRLGACCSCCCVGFLPSGLASLRTVVVPPGYVVPRAEPKYMEANRLYQTYTESVQFRLEISYVDADNIYIYMSC